ncbi:lipoprotein LpqH [Mycobacterium camsae]|uniref:lipoprotein LpqH n=1 Tax=Mycobacterium gordonae TaxID=1778 RepID=UPI0019809A35|nr:lipoprotein LpqH [Mycobacterium gordonae]
MAVALAGTALVAASLAASLAGCSRTTFSPTVITPTVTYQGRAIAPTNDADVVVDGEKHRVDGQIACTALDGGETVIAIGTETRAVRISLTDHSDAPGVKMVILQNLVGYNLFVMNPPEKGQASATKDGRRYTVGGMSWGLDAHNDDVKKPFLITLTCP